jgi:hypothetical protein
MWRRDPLAPPIATYSRVFQRIPAYFTESFFVWMLVP